MSVDKQNTPGTTPMLRLARRALLPILSGKQRKYVIPPDIRVYAVGDIHGRADLLRQVFDRMDQHQSDQPAPRFIEVFLGDYVDRGSSSREVIDLLLKRGRTRETVFLRGNHEMLFAEFFTRPAILTDWQQIGGLETLMSYGLRPTIHATISQQEELAQTLDLACPQRHRDFLSSLRNSFVCGDFFFVHAGVRPGVALTDQRDEDLLWIRNEFLDHTGDFGKIIVHGHTPVEEMDIRSNRINIDTGAYMSGRLTCVALEGSDIEAV